MSFNVGYWAADAKCEEVTDKVILLILAIRANDQTGFFECFPSIPSLIKNTGMSRSGVFASLNRLYAAGLITKISPDGNRKSNTYRLNVDAPNTEQNSDDAKTHRPTSTGHRDHGGTGQSRTIQSHPGSHEQRPDQYGPSIFGEAGWASDPIHHHRAAG